MLFYTKSLFIAMLSITSFGMAQEGARVLHGEARLAAQGEIASIGSKPVVGHREAPLPVWHDDVRDEAPPVELLDVVVEAPRPKAKVSLGFKVVDQGELLDTDSQPQVWVCGPWRESKVGGMVQSCEWKNR
jgi:hypothetical protein